METKAPKKALIIEFNEFNVELLEIAVKKLHLPSISRLLQFKKFTYISDDKFESYDGGNLEPWVQWVSVHTGLPSSRHQIRNLGETPDSSLKQFWEILGDHKLTTGVWGVMSGRNPVDRPKDVPFFIPDPWTVSESATPNELNDFLGLPRYIACNYFYNSLKTILANGWKLVLFIFKAGMAGKAFIESLRLLPSFLKFGPKYFLFSLAFEYISAQLFLKYKSYHRPDCSIFFINSLAHIQHHYWTEEKDEITPSIAHGLQYLDRLFSDLIEKREENETIVLHNGLSQKNIMNEEPWLLYRQKDPINFIANIGLGPNQVEQLMTHDAHVNFETKEDFEYAFNILSSSKLGSKNLFHVERSSTFDKRLFYRIDITSDIEGNPKVKIAEKEFSFFELFEKVVRRTGTHIPTGTIYSEDIEFDNGMPNHEFNNYIYRYFGLDVAGK
jgi:hypothetical protein